MTKVDFRRSLPYEALRSERVREISGLNNSCVELVGASEMVLEIARQRSTQAFPNPQTRSSRLKQFSGTSRHV